MLLIWRVHLCQRTIIALLHPLIVIRDSNVCKYLKKKFIFVFQRIKQTLGFSTVGDVFKHPLHLIELQLSVSQGGKSRHSTTFSVCPRWGFPTVRFFDIILSGCYIHTSCWGVKQNFKFHQKKLVGMIGDSSELCSAGASVFNSHIFWCDEAGTCIWDPRDITTRCEE